MKKNLKSALVLSAIAGLVSGGYVLASADAAHAEHKPGHKAKKKKKNKKAADAGCGKNGCGGEKKHDAPAGGEGDHGQAPGDAPAEGTTH